MSPKTLSKIAKDALETAFKAETARDSSRASKRLKTHFRALDQVSMLKLVSYDLKKDGIEYYPPLTMSEDEWLPFLRHVDLHRYKAWDKPVKLNKAWDFGEGNVHEPYLKHPQMANKHSLLLTAGRVGSHTDSEELPRYSYHLVIANDGYCAHPSSGKWSEYPKQVGGTIIGLDIYRYHQVSRDIRFGHYVGVDYPVWSSLCFNTDTVFRGPGCEKTLHDSFKHGLCNLLLIDGTKAL